MVARRARRPQEHPSGPGQERRRLPLPAPRRSTGRRSTPASRTSSRGHSIIGSPRQPRAGARDPRTLRRAVCSEFAEHAPGSRPIRPSGATRSSASSAACSPRRAWRPWSRTSSSSTSSSASSISSSTTPTARRQASRVRSFDWERPETGEHARVLLLSATPYRALDGRRRRRRRQPSRGLPRHRPIPCRQRRPAPTSSAACCVTTSVGYTAALRKPLSVCVRSASEIETLLTRYIARTERIGAAGQHDAMLRHVPRIASPTTRRPAPVPARAGRRPRARSARRHRALEERPIPPELPRRLQAAQPLRRGLQVTRPGTRARGATQRDEGRPARPREAVRVRRCGSGRSAHARTRQGRDRQRGMAPAVDPTLDALPRARRRVRAPAARAASPSGSSSPPGTPSRAQPPACSATSQSGGSRSRPTRARRTRPSAEQASGTDSPSRSEPTSGAPACPRSRCSTRRRRSPPPLTRARSPPSIKQHDRAICSRGRKLRSRHCSDRLPPGDPEGDIDERWYWAAPLMLDAARRLVGASRSGRGVDGLGQASVRAGKSLAGARGTRTLGRGRHARSGARATSGGPCRRARQTCGRWPGNARAAGADARHRPSRRRRSTPGFRPRGSRGRSADCSTRPRPPHCCAPAERRARTPTGAR